MLSFASYDDTAVRVTVRWVGALAAGVGSDWAITIRSQATTLNQTMSLLRITTTPLTFTGDNYSAVGPPVTLVDRALSTVLAPGMEWSTTETLDPGAAGTASITIRVESSNIVQGYVSQRSYIVDLP